jgi:hypothetical protein
MMVLARKTRTCSASFVTLPALPRFAGRAILTGNDVTHLSRIRAVKTAGASAIGTGVLLALLSAGPSAQQLPALDPLDATGRITYFLAGGMRGSEYRPADRDLATWALRAWERALEGRLRFEEAAEREALIRVRWVPASAGQYGEMRSLIVNGRRGAEVFIRPDVTALGPDIALAAGRDPLLRDTIVYLTCLHELGHALGLSHTANYDDIMYFFGFGGDIPGYFGRYRAQLRSRDDIARVPGLSASDVASVRARYPPVAAIR